MRGCGTCEREGHLPHNDHVRVADACPESVERRRRASVVRHDRYVATPKGRAAQDKANARYENTVAGVLRNVRANANRRGTRG